MVNVIINDLFYNTLCIHNQVHCSLGEGIKDTQWNLVNYKNLRDSKIMRDSFHHNCHSSYYI